jgi:hypothetical protein
MNIKITERSDFNKIVEINFPNGELVRLRITEGLNQIELTCVDCTPSITPRAANQILITCLDIS